MIILLVLFPIRLLVSTIDSAESWFYNICFGYGGMFVEINRLNIK